MNIIDISHLQDSHTPIYPEDSPTSLFQSVFLSSDHFSDFTLKTNLHVGTHLGIWSLCLHGLLWN